MFTDTVKKTPEYKFNDEFGDIKSLKFEDVSQFELEHEHYDDLKTSLNYDTVWSLDSGILQLDQKIFIDKPFIVTYKVIKDMSDDFQTTTYQTFTAVTKDGTVGELWKAAENCFQQAKLALNDWHYFVEDLVMQEDGTLQLVTGS